MAAKRVCVCVCGASVCAVGERVLVCALVRVCGCGGGARQCVALLLLLLLRTKHIHWGNREPILDLPYQQATHSYHRSGQVPTPITHTLRGAFPKLCKSRF